MKNRSFIFRIAYLLIPFLLSLSFACQKDDIESIDTPSDTIVIDTNSSDTLLPSVIKDSIYAGIYNNNFTYHSFTNPVELNVIWDSSGYYGGFSNTVPMVLLGDSINLCFRMRIANPDSFIIILNSGMTMEDVYLIVCPYDSLGFLMETKSYPGGLGTVVSVSSASSLSKNDLIRSKSEWYFNYSNNPYNYLSLFYYPAEHAPSGYDGGAWFNVTSIKYLGFSYKNHLGWIEFDMKDKTKPRFLSYAIKN